MSRIKVVSYNIHKGYDLYRNYVLPDIRRAILDIAPDILLLQEIKGLHQQAEDQLVTLAGDDWIHRAYGQNNHQRVDHYGNAILSRWPLSNTKNMDLTNHVFEKRGLLAAEVQHSAISDPVILLTVHLDLTHGGRIRQTRKIKSYLSREFSMTSPLILAGDFNDWNGKLSPVFLTELNFREAFIDHSGTHALSFPSQMPFLPLDRVYYRGFHVREAQVLRGAPWSKLSDHLPLYVELEFAGHSASDELGASSAD